nr:hypothetical protein OH826_20105 [Streptomyces sp. NBC_00899]
MTTQPAKGAQQDDAAAAAHAADWFLADGAAAARADLDVARRRVKAAEQRLADYRAGGRLTHNEALFTYGWSLATAEGLAEQLLHGEPEVTKEDLREAEEVAEAVRRGLVADGFDLPDTSAPVKRGHL